MDEPTEEQIKELWERCGLHYTEPYWVDDNNNLAFYGEVYSELLRTINLINLFKYAVPKDLRVEFVPKGDDVECSLIYKHPTPSDNWLDHQYSWRIKGSGTASTKALALFWAIWQALKEGV